MERFAGRYALLRSLGSGGMGTVHLALDLTTGAEVAIKRVHRGAVGSTPDALRHEFELLARVRHPAVVSVRELGFSPDGTPYFTMEYVPGAASDRMLARGDWRSLAFAAAEAAQGLEALHEAGVVHGDLKPSNLLVIAGAGPNALPAGVRILDFGLAALLDRAREGHRGTQGFTAPEVVRGAMADVASDLYSFGATLYALAAGAAALAGSNSGASSRRGHAAAPSSAALDEAGAPPALSRLILQLMAPEPGERPRTAREVRAELERIEPAARRTIAQRLRTEIVIGRERELARLERWLAQAPDGPVSIVIAGEPGAGKTALLSELAVRAALGGRCVIRFSCAAFSAHGALALALGRRLAAESGASPQAGEATVRALALLERSEFPRGEAELGTLVDALVGWAHHLRQRGTLPLLLLDDRERLDPLSGTLLRRLLAHPLRRSLRCAWAGRGESGGVSADDRLSIDAGQAEKLVLAPLAARDAERLIATRLHQPVPRDLLSFLLGRSGGHPGLLVELLRSVAEQGTLAESDEGLVFDAAALARAPLPSGFEASLTARLAGLEAPARAAARLLAVLGRPATGSELEALDPSVNASALTALLATGLATGEVDGRCTLVPPALGALVLAGAEPAERARLHRLALAQPALGPAARFAHLAGAGEVPEALAAAEAAFAAHADAALALEAAALAEPGSPEAAATWLDRAAVVLTAQGRHLAALPHLERALALDPRSEARFGRWRLLANVYLRTDRLDELAALAARAEADATPPRELSLILSNDSAGMYSRGDSAGALASALRALELGMHSGDDESIAVAELTVSGAYIAVGDHDEADLHAGRSQAAFARAGLHGGHARALNQRGNAALIRGDRVADESWIRQGLAIARKEGERHACQELLIGLGMVQVRNGRWEAAQDALEESLRLALEDGRSQGVTVATANLALVEGLCGRSARALRRSSAAVRLTRASHPALESLAWRTRAMALRVAGHDRRAERAIGRGVAIANRLDQPHEQGWLSLEYVRWCTGRSRWKEAGETAAQVLLRGRLADPTGRLIACAAVGRAALRQRDFAAADGCIGECATLLASNPAPYAEAHASQLRAERALLNGDLSAGAELARRTLALFAALPAPAERAAAALEFARSAREADGASGVPVGEWLQEAADAFERLGDLPGRARALALMVEWLQRTRGPAGSSARDRDLLASVGSLLDSLSDLQVLERRAMQLAVEHLDAERGVLLLHDPKSGHLLPKVEHGAVDAATRDRAVGYSRRVVEQVAHSGGSLLIADAPTNPDMQSESVVGLGLRSILCVPLYGAGKVVGAVYVDDSRRADAFTRDDRALLEGFAHLMATAIENSRGHDEVRRANEQLVGENLSLRREARVRFQPHNFIGHSSAMQAVLAVVERAAQTNTTVLVTGENGTGKELIARTLHHSGRRHLAPFVGVNCGAIPETLLESELFGILPNVATGVRGRDGRFVQANGGTLFLDEIGEMPMKQQVALLAVLANREITPVGGGQPISVDVRIIAATNRELRRSLEEGTFREDLYYRLNVIPIEVPPLRDHKADIPEMAHHFSEQIARQQEREAPELSAEFLAALMQSDWPGNVRELQNYIERVMAMTPGGPLKPHPLPRDLESKGARLRIGRGRKLPDVVGDVELRLIREALDRAGGNQSQAARELGIHEQALRYRLRKYSAVTIRQKRRTRQKRRD